MKPVLLFLTNWCPHCKRALNIIDDLRKDNPEYEKLEIKVINEDREPHIADQYDYYYVPTFYVDGKKLLEGVPSKDKIRDVLEHAVRS